MDQHPVFEGNTVVHIPQTFRFQADMYRKNPVALRQPGQPPCINRANRWDQGRRHRRGEVGYNMIRFKNLAILRRNPAGVNPDRFFPGQDAAAQGPDPFAQPLRYLHALPFQPPRALEEGGADLRIDIEREGLQVHVHPQGPAAQHLPEQRVRNRLLQESSRRTTQQRPVVGTKVPDAGSNLLQGSQVGRQGFLLSRELFRHPGDECRITGRNRPAPPVNDDLFAAVQPPPGKVQQAMVAHQQLQRLSRPQAADIVQARVKGIPPPVEALQGSAGSRLFFKDGHTVAVACQDMAAFQAAEARPYDEYVRHSGSRASNWSLRNRRNWKGIYRNVSQSFAKESATWRNPHPDVRN